MKEQSDFDFERFKQEAMEGLYSGKKVTGTDGIFAPLMSIRPTNYRFDS